MAENSQNNGMQSGTHSHGAHSKKHGAHSPHGHSSPSHGHHSPHHKHGHHNSPQKGKGKRLLHDTHELDSHVIDEIRDGSVSFGTVEKHGNENSDDEELPVISKSSIRDMQKLTHALLSEHDKKHSPENSPHHSPHHEHGNKKHHSPHHSPKHGHGSPRGGSSPHNNKSPSHKKQSETPSHGSTSPKKHVHSHTKHKKHGHSSSFPHNNSNKDPHTTLSADQSAKNKSDVAAILKKYEELEAAKQAKLGKRGFKAAVEKIKIQNMFKTAIVEQVNSDVGLVGWNRDSETGEYEAGMVSPRDKKNMGNILLTEEDKNKKKKTFVSTKSILIPDEDRRNRFFNSHSDSDTSSLYSEVNVEEEIDDFFNESLNLTWNRGSVT
tara:strand:+ start:136 stop:1272 length:1137 start_codon:yes stop_codon:yes gene_type:complete